MTKKDAALLLSVIKVMDIADIVDPTPLKEYLENFQNDRHCEVPSTEIEDLSG